VKSLLLSVSLIVVGVSAVAGNEFSVGIEMPSQVPMAPAVAKAMQAIGIDYVNYFVKPSKATPEREAEKANVEMLRFVDALELDFALSCYVVDPPIQCVEEARRRDARFQGIVFDELAHCRLLNHHRGVEKLAQLADVSSIEAAYEKSLLGYRALHDKYGRLDVDVTATHVWPVLLHIAARAGFTPCPKICKEFYSSVSYAIGMGAALQYDRELCVDVDMWYYDLVPGHPAEEVESNLKLAYWLGADRVYLEGCGFNLLPIGQQGIPFSLLTLATPNRYQLTEHGEMLRRFIREYIPNHPRTWTFRDVRPEVAIVRFPDSCYGQRYVSDGQTQWHQGLFGAANLSSNEDTEAWFGLWNLLTCGRSGQAGLSYFTKYLAAAGYESLPQEGVVPSLYSRPVQAESHKFFAPLRGVVVFDHLVGYKCLEHVPLIFLTGVSVSEETQRALVKRAREGATVVVWKKFASMFGVHDYDSGTKTVTTGRGKIVVADNFSCGEVWQACWPLMPRVDEIRYRFRDQTVVMKKITDNRVEVQIQ
jgi:hypothetical protein